MDPVGYFLDRKDLPCASRFIYYTHLDRVLLSMYSNLPNNGLYYTPSTPSNTLPISFDENPYLSASKTVQFRVAPATPLKRPHQDENSPQTFFRPQPWKKAKTGRPLPTSRPSKPGRTPLKDVPSPLPSVTFSPFTPTPGSPVGLVVMGLYPALREDFLDASFSRYAAEHGGHEGEE